MEVGEEVVRLSDEIYTVHLSDTDEETGRVEYITDRQRENSGEKLVQRRKDGDRELVSYSRAEQ